MPVHIKYVHTNIIAKDWKKLSLFYQHVFDCRPVPPQRDLEGAWLDDLTGMENVHVTGEHLALPGYPDALPTLEIFSYDRLHSNQPHFLNNTGLAHLAFEVDDVAAILEKVKQEGGDQVGALIQTEYPNQVTATFVYVRDLEGNIIELQSWSKK